MSSANDTARTLTERAGSAQACVSTALLLPPLRHRRLTEILTGGILLLSQIGTLASWVGPGESRGPQRQGAVQGFAGSVAAVASIVGLLAGGVLYGLRGAYVFVISAVLTLLTFALAFAIPKMARN